MRAVIFTYAAAILPDLFEGLHDPKGCSSCPVKFTDATDFLIILSNIIGIMLSLAGLVAVGFFIFAGIQYITSGGEPAKTTKAKDTIVNALIGLVFVLCAFAAVRFVAGRF